MPGYSYADVVERLFSEFEEQYSLPAIVDVVRECKEQLQCSSEAALPELLERLARQRLRSALQPESVSSDR